MNMTNKGEMEVPGTCATAAGGPEEVLDRSSSHRWMFDASLK